MAEVIKKKKQENIIPQKQPTIDAKPQTYQIGNRVLSKEDYNAAKGALGFKSGSGNINTPAVQEVLAKSKETDLNILADRRTAELAQEAALSQIEANRRAEELKAIIENVGKVKKEDNRKRETFIQRDEFGKETELSIPTDEPLEDMGRILPSELGLNIGGGAAGGSATAAAGAAIAGTAVLPATIGAGVLGAIAGAFKISSEKRQLTKESKALADGSISNIQSAFRMLNQAKTDEERAEIINFYNSQWEDINLAERRLQQLSQTEFRNQLSQARDELEDVMKYKERKVIYDQMFKNALLKPSPQASLDTSINLPQ